MVGESQKLSDQTELESKMVTDLKIGYASCMAYFSKPFDTFNDNVIFNDKNEFLSNLAHDFYNKFHTHYQVLSDSEAEKKLEKYGVIYIKFKGGALMYPLLFTRFMDRLNYDENLSVVPSDTSSLTHFINSFPSKMGLDPFLEGFFKEIKKIVIPLRRRELEVLKILSNPLILQKDIEGNVRTTPPTAEEILKILNRDRKQEKTIKRAKKFLHSNNICYFQNVIMNNSKFGFIYVLTEGNSSNIPSKYQFWSIPSYRTDYNIFCLPIDQTDSFLQGLDYLPLTQWNWNVSLAQFNPNKSDQPIGWEKYQILPFTDSSHTFTNYISWKLNDQTLDKLSEEEINIIQRLSSVGASGLTSISNLSEKLPSHSVHHFIKKMIEYEVFQFYPNINFIGLDVIMGFYLEISEKSLYNSVLQILLSYPISHIMSNDQQRVALGYIHIPRMLFAEFMDKVANFRSIYKNETFILSDTTRPHTVLRCLDLTAINFKYKKGIAY